MITVQQLIDLLSEVTDKTIPVYIPVERQEKVLVGKESGFTLENVISFSGLSEKHSGYASFEDPLDENRHPYPLTEDLPAADAAFLLFPEGFYEENLIEG